MKLKNDIVIDGNLVRDPVIKITSKGTKICNFSLAHNRYFKKGDDWESEVSYFDVQAWNQLAERVEREGAKGMLAKVSGRLKQERWLQDGQSRSRVVIVAEFIELASQTKDEPQKESEEYVDNDVPF